ncbi:hypothetical protein TIFTF001_036860 [Ficus carica]|uniref:Uncharacterized protein n=1 Tax=Ficus carica TaxID=3494 RepID=A0AA88E8U2_FICCA|nr:hypothetical protein TIFTF001_036860 [Ficus carica]
MGCAPIFEEPTVVPNLPPKTSAPQPSSDTNSEWQEFQKEIRGEVVSIKNKLAYLKKGQKKSNKLMRRVIKMLAANIFEKGHGEAHTAFHVSNSQKTNVHMADSDALKTTPPHIGTARKMM